jgi:hypothetical protein
VIVVALVPMEGREFMTCLLTTSLQLYELCGQLRQLTELERNSDPKIYAETIERIEQIKMSGFLPIMSRDPTTEHFFRAFRVVTKYLAVFVDDPSYRLRSCPN